MYFCHKKCLIVASFSLHAIAWNRACSSALKATYSSVSYVKPERIYITPKLAQRFFEKFRNW